MQIRRSVREILGSGLALPSSFGAASPPRPTLSDLFASATGATGATDALKAERNQRIATAYSAHGYTLAEVARHPGLPCTTTNKAVRAAEQAESWQGKA